jgi:4-hydroxy-2-oxoglutarate aldolase
MSVSLQQSKSDLRLDGIFPPIPTPFGADGEVSRDRLVENLQKWNEYGLSGYVVLGSNGEAAYLDEGEKISVLEAARGAIPEGKLLIAGTGCESLRQTIGLTQEAARLGADAALVLTPHFYRLSVDDLIRYYAEVADATAIPIVIYNVPKFTQVDLDAAIIARIAEHPNVIGIKDSGGNITKIGDVVRLTSREFQVLAGSAGFLFASLALGAVGGVVALANIAPRQVVEIYRLFQAKDWDGGAALQRKMIPVNTAVTARYGVPGLKAALDMLGWYGGPVRAPLSDLGQSSRVELRKICAAGGL